MYGLSPVLNVTASVVPFMTDLMVGILRPITCSGDDWLIDVLQYTVYAVMTTFIDIGTDQLEVSEYGEPRTGNSVKLGGEDGTEEKNELQALKIVLMKWCLVTKYI